MNYIKQLESEFHKEHAESFNPSQEWLFENVQNFFIAKLLEREESLSKAIEKKKKSFRSPLPVIVKTGEELIFDSMSGKFEEMKNLIEKGDKQGIIYAFQHYITDVYNQAISDCQSLLIKSDEI